jgi:sugar phosphate isomerase/epimerase
LARPVTLFTGQWADLPFETLCQKAKEFGYDGLELACWGDHFEVDKGQDQAYTEGRWELLNKYGLQCFAISNHLVGQAVCDLIDERHKSILPPHIWGDGDPEGVRQRAAEEMKATARAAANLGVKVVNGFTGSSIWHLLYSFPPVSEAQIAAGYQDFADRWNPILDEFDRVGVRFALEVHPTEIAFDIASAQRTLDAIGKREAFGFNYDPSHLGYQNVDYVKFIDRFADRIYHAHMKDVWWSPVPTEAGVFGGHTNFGDPRRSWDFRSIGRGRVDFEEIIRALNRAGYEGPLSVEWEDMGMDREAGAAEAAAYLHAKDFKPSSRAFDAAFSEE